jgi:hypothetical protein
MEVWWPVHRDVFEGKRSYSPDIVAFLHDPLTLAVPFESSFLTLERLRLRPEIRDGGFHLSDDSAAPEIEVAVDVDAPGFVQFLLERLLRLP